MKILIIDDDLALLENFSLIIKFKRPSFSVSTASDGLEGLERIEQEAFDLIISDIRMPLFDGFQLKRELNRKKIDIPVIFLSALMIVDASLVGRQLGAIGFLNKPLSGDELIAAIERADEYNKRIRPRQEYLTPVAELLVEVQGSEPVVQKLSGDYSIGRSPDRDIRLLSDKCSREHALLNRTESSLSGIEGVKNHYRLIDVSRNGLLVNTQEVKGYALLSHGDIIDFPGCRMRYFLLSQREKDSPFSTRPSDE